MIKQITFSTSHLKTFKTLGFTLFLLVLGLNSANAQWTYTVNYQADIGQPGGLSTDAYNTTTGWVNVIDGPQAANVWSPAITIPFPFDFYGTPTTTCYASQNGLVNFSTTAPVGAPPNANTNLPDASVPDNTICGFWDEFTANAPTGGNDDIITKTFGTAPNRQLWIKWFSFEKGNPSNGFSYFAIVLEESTNKIYVVDEWASGNPALTTTVGVQLNATTAVQFGANNIDHTANTTNINTNDVYEFIPELLVADNVGVLSIDNPFQPLATGFQTVDVTIRNYGINDLDSVDIGWEIDGTTQTPVQWTNAPLAPNTNDGPINLGFYNFPTGFTTIKAWTVNPNGVPDSFNGNDTVEISLCTELSGVYTVGGVGPDFATITEAIDALNNCGINGPVTLNIAPGTYTGSYVLTPIAGSSVTNTVTFDGGSAVTTTLTHDATGVQAVVSFQGADYITFQNLTVVNTGTVDAWGFHLKDVSDFNTIDNCIITMVQATNMIDVAAVVGSNDLANDASEGNNCNNLTVSNCTITGGERGFVFEGPFASANWMRDINILNNNVSFVEDYGVFVDNIDSITIIGNSFTNFTQATNADGINCTDIANFIIDENNVNVPDWGIRIADGNFDIPATFQASISNNMVYSTGDYGIYLDDVNDLDIFHNTSYGRPAIRMNDMINLDVRNNIFYAETDYAFEMDDNSPLPNLDYNLYYTPASNAQFAKFGFATFTDLAAWQTGFGTLNTNSVELEPFFLNAPSDLHLIGVNGNDIGDNSAGIAIDIDGETRPQAPSTVVDMGADEYTPLTDDVSLDAYITPSSNACGDSASVITVVFTNLGVNNVTTMSIVSEVSGTAASTINFTYTGNLAFGESDTVAIGTINSYAGGTFNFLTWTELTGDLDNSNDTLALDNISFIPFLPQGFDAFSCGTDTTTIYADTSYNVSYEWYDAPVGGTLVGTGSSLFVPSIAAQSTYYLQYGAGADTLETTYAGGNGCSNGNMFDANTLVGSTITGFCVNTDAAAGSNTVVDVYFISNDTYTANTANAGAWTLQGSYTVVSAGAGNPTCFSLTGPIPVLVGQSTAIYVDFQADYTNGTQVYQSNSGNNSISTGSGFCTAFNGGIAGRMFNGTVLFGAEACSIERTAITATNNPGVTLDLGPDSLVCGTSFTLDAGPQDASNTILWSTLENTATISVNSTDNYFVEVTDTLGCYATDTVAITIDPLDVNLGGDFEICENGTTTLDAGSSFPNMQYVWQDNFNGQLYIATSDGLYYVTVSDALGCSQSDSVNISYSSVSVDLGGDQAVCFGTNVTLDAGLNNSYLWNDGTINPTLSTSTSGSYSVVVTNNIGCEAGDTIDISVADETIAGFTSIMTNGPTWFLTDTSIASDSVIYDMGDGTKRYNSNPEYTYSANGVYTVCQYAFSACGTDTTCIDLDITGVGINDLENNLNLSLYPNPTNGSVVLSINREEINELSIEVYSIIGQEVFVDLIQDNTKLINKELDFTSLPAGAYLMKVSDGNSFLVKTFIKN